MNAFGLRIANVCATVSENSRQLRSYLYPESYRSTKPLHASSFGKDARPNPRRTIREQKGGEPSIMATTPLLAYLRHAADIPPLAYFPLTCFSWSNILDLASTVVKLEISIINFLKSSICDHLDPLESRDPLSSAIVHFRFESQSTT